MVLRLCVWALRYTCVEVYSVDIVAKLWAWAYWLCLVEMSLYACSCVLLLCALVVCCCCVHWTVTLWWNERCIKWQGGRSHCVVNTDDWGHQLMQCATTLGWSLNLSCCWGSLCVCSFLAVLESLSSPATNTLTRSCISSLQCDNHNIVACLQKKM